MHSEWLLFGPVQMWHDNRNPTLTALIFANSNQEVLWTVVYRRSVCIEQISGLAFLHNYLLEFNIAALTGLFTNTQRHSFLRSISRRRKISLVN